MSFLAWVMISLSLSLASWAGTKFPELRAGQCYSDPESKTYLSGLKAGGAQSLSIAKDIGSERLSKLVNTSDTHNYFCLVTCQNSAAKRSTQWVVLQDNPSHFSNMNGFICTGVQIENVQIVGSIYGPQPVVSAFWAFDSSLIELRDWLRDTNFHLPEVAANSLWTQLSSQLNVVAAAYVMTQSPQFKDAGKKLSEIAARTSSGRELLKTYIPELTKGAWKLNSSEMTAQTLIDMNLKAFGRFLEFTDL